MSDSLDVLREVVIVGLLISTPTWQICKPVIENFYLFSVVILIFLAVYNLSFHLFVQDKIKGSLLYSKNCYTFNSAYRYMYLHA